MNPIRIFEYLEFITRKNWQRIERNGGGYVKKWWTLMAYKNWKRRRLPDLRGAFSAYFHDSTFNPSRSAANVRKIKQLWRATKSNGSSHFQLRYPGDSVQLVSNLDYKNFFFKYDANLLVLTGTVTGIIIKFRINNYSNSSNSLLIEPATMCIMLLHIYFPQKMYVNCISFQISVLFYIYLKRLWM